MTRASRGIPDIQEKARGNDMKKDTRKAAGPKMSKKSSLSIKAKRPMDSMSVGAANSLPMGPMAGMKKGGMCKGYAKGGSIDGVAHKGKTRGKIC
jgi:hypothetical protein